jgi:hypothetical protein
VIDPLGPTLTSIRDFPAVAAITPRVRGAALKASDKPPAVVLRRLGDTRNPFGNGSRTGLQRVTLVALCYGLTPQQATDLRGAVSDAVHMRGPRTDAQGRLIYLSIDESGGGATLDPDTRWPFEEAVIDVIAAAQVVP